MSLRERFEKLVAKGGFTIQEPKGVEIPPGMEWVLDIILEVPGVKVIVRAVGSDKENKLILAMPIGFSEIHLNLMNQLPTEERIALMARMLREVINVCPYCRVGFAGQPPTPQGIVAEIHYINGLPEEQRVIDDIHRLVSVFMVVNAVLWERFPAAAPQLKPQMYT